MQEIEFVLWAIKKGEPKWAEQVIVETKDKEKLEKAKQWAKDNGFESLRVMEHKGEKPNFKNVF